MPSRHWTLGIIVFWLATSGWLFQRELWPRLRPGERPPFTIDLDQEAGQKSPAHWTVFRNGQTVGSASTSVASAPSPPPNWGSEGWRYELSTQIKFDHFKYSVSLLGNLLLEANIEKMHSIYRVTPEGKLREAVAQVAVVVNGHPVKVGVSGHVEGGLFRAHWKVQSPLLSQELQTDPVEVAAQHSMLNPLQPWNRLLNVRENTRWRITLFDPLADSLAALTPGKGLNARFLEAGVLEGTQNLFWNGADVPCLVIEYRGENMEARTWVRQSDGLVLRQEASRPNERWALERTPQ